MDTSRRDLLVAATALTVLAAGRSDAANAPAPPGLMEVLHVYADPAGKTHWRRVPVHAAGPLPVTRVVAGSIGAGDSLWGTAPQKRFSINTTGDIDVELRDGTRLRAGKGDLVFIDDQGGDGHRSHMLTAVANLFLIVPDDFDLLAWAGQPA